MSQQINLLRPRTSTNRAAAWTIGAIALGALALGGYGWRASAQTSQLRAEVAASEAALVQARASMAAAQQRAAGPGAESLAAEVAELRLRSDAMRKLVDQASPELIGSSRGYSGHFAALASIAQDDVWVTGVNIGRNGKDVTITGQAIRNDDVLAYVKRLNTAYEPIGVRFNSIEFQTAAPAAAAGAASAVRVPSFVSFKVS